jgi:hypothetical protein
MPDLGPPVAYLALPEGVPVYAADDSRVGDVEHVLADEETDIFDGLVVGTGEGHRFVDASLVDELYERGVVLSIDGAEALSLPEPSASPAVLEADPADTAESDLTRKLRRAWDFVSGNY